VLLICREDFPLRRVAQHGEAFTHVGSEAFVEVKHGILGREVYNIKRLHCKLLGNYRNCSDKEESQKSVQASLANDRSPPPMLHTSFG